MISLTKQVNSLETVMEKIEAKIEALQEKMDALEENACDMDRDMTASEWDRWYKWEEEIDELRAEADDIGNALDYLKDYAD